MNVPEWPFAQWSEVNVYSCCYRGCVEVEVVVDCRIPALWQKITFNFSNIFMRTVVTGTE